MAGNEGRAASAQCAWSGSGTHRGDSDGIIPWRAGDRALVRVRGLEPLTRRLDVDVATLAHPESDQQADCGTAATSTHSGHGLLPGGCASSGNVPARPWPVRPNCCPWQAGRVGGGSRLAAAGWSMCMWRPTTILAARSEPWSARCPGVRHDLGTVSPLAAVAPAMGVIWHPSDTLSRAPIPAVPASGCLPTKMSPLQVSAIAGRATTPV